MGILSFSYGWSTFVAAVKRFLRRCKVLYCDLVAGGVPGKDKDSNEPIKKIDDEVNETDTDTSNMPVNANDMGIEDSATWKICVCDPLTVEIIKDDDVHVVVHDKVGIWGRISSAIGMVKQKIRDLRSFCRRCFSYGLSAAAKVDSSAMAYVVERLKNYLQDEQARADLGWAALEIAKDFCSNAIRKKLRLLPGGLKAYDRISMSMCRLRGPLRHNYQSLSNTKEIEDLKRDIKELRARIDKLEKQCSACTCGCNKLHDQPEVLKPDFGLTSKNMLQEDSISETPTPKSGEFS